MAMHCTLYRVLLHQCSLLLCPTRPELAQLVQLTSCEEPQPRLCTPDQPEVQPTAVASTKSGRRHGSRHKPDQTCLQVPPSTLHPTSVCHPELPASERLLPDAAAGSLLLLQ